MSWYQKLKDKMTGRESAAEETGQKNSRTGKFKNQGLELLNEEQQKTARRNAAVEAAARKNGITIGEAFLKMEAIRKKYGMTYTEIAQKDLIGKSDEALEKERSRMEKNHQRVIEKICAATDWSYEEAEARAKHVKEKFGISARLYHSRQLYLLSDEELKQRQKELAELREQRIEQVSKETGWNRTKVIRHMKSCSVNYGIDQDYYMILRCWELTDEELDGYATIKTSAALGKKYNRRGSAKYVADKGLFNQAYGEFTNRKYWMNRDTSFEDFQKFAEGQEEIFCKPLDLNSGRGAKRIPVGEDLRAMYEELMSWNRMLFEECVKQHEEMSAFYPGSVNTVRLVTLLKDDVCHNLCSFVRFGCGGVTDNFSAGGLTCGVDEKTGVILTPAIDKKGRVYESHPLSGRKFEGFRIPNWDMVLEVAGRAAGVQPGLRYVGWDLAVCQDKVVIIEGNSQPGLGTYQATFAYKKEGKLHLFEEYLR